MSTTTTTSTKECKKREQIFYTILRIFFLLHLQMPVIRIPYLYNVIFFCLLVFPYFWSTNTHTVEEKLEWKKEKKNSNHIKNWYHWLRLIMMLMAVSLFQYLIPDWSFLIVIITVAGPRNDDKKRNVFTLFYRQDNGKEKFTFFLLLPYRMLAAVVFG